MDITTAALRDALGAKNKNRDDEHIEGTRRVQDKVGKLLEKLHDQNLIYQNVMFRNFTGCWVAPKEQAHDGVIMYLHGGGYCCGNLDYAKGFASVLADKYKIRVFAVAYRLAPEYPYPAALEDAERAYEYLLGFGYDADRIVLIGESAGGGLANCLALKLKDENKSVPAGIIGISPWTDLTLSGKTIAGNSEIDVAVTPGQVKYYAEIYSGDRDRAHPYISPLFGDFTGFPPSLVIVGSDEILLDDSLRFAKKLEAAAVDTELVIGDGLWHVYPLYGIKESKQAYDEIRKFLQRLLNDNI